MRCFTDAELRRGIVAVALEQDGAADLFEVFLLAAVTTDDQTTNDQSRSDRVGHPIPETTQRRRG